MKVPRRQFLQSGSGRCRAAGCIARRVGASLSVAAGAHRSCHLPPGGSVEHLRAPDRPMAIGAAWPAVRHREPAGRRHQYRHRGGRACGPGRLYAPAGRVRRATINATLYDKLSFNFIRDIAPVAAIVRTPFVMVVHPSVPAKTVPEFIAYAKANPANSAWRRPASARVRM